MMYDGWMWGTAGLGRLGIDVRCDGVVLGGRDHRHCSCHPLPGRLRRRQLRFATLRPARAPRTRSPDASLGAREMKTNTGSALRSCAKHR
jgi:hypothetical protein